jgi:hypothetical protein
MTGIGAPSLLRYSLPHLHRVLQLWHWDQNHQRPLRTLTNLFTCTTIDLLTGAYGMLTIQNTGGNLVRIGTVLIKILPDNKLLVDANVDAGYDLVSVGVSGNCNLLRLTNCGLEISTCSAFSLYQTLPGLFATSSSQVLGLSKSLGLTCWAGELQSEIQAVVRKLVFVGTSC